MSTPHHISANYDAVMKKIELADLDEAQKMFYRAFLEQTKESTNGRTESEKIQDLTEAVAGLAQISISRQIESAVFEKEVTRLQKCVDTLQIKISKIGEIQRACPTVNTLRIPQKPVDKILDFLKSLPWSVTALGLGLCGLLAYKPQFIEFIKLVFIH